MSGKYSTNRFTYCYEIILTFVRGDVSLNLIYFVKVFVEAVVSLSIPESLLSPEICTYLRDTSILLLTDEEVRVRIASGDLLGTLGKKYGASIYEDSKGYY